MLVIGEIETVFDVIKTYCAVYGLMSRDLKNNKDKRRHNQNTLVKMENFFINFTKLMSSIKGYIILNIIPCIIA